MNTIEQLTEFFKSEFPQADFVIESVGQQSATLRKKIDHQHLRPGGTVSGPTLMAMADAALYAAILGEIEFNASIATVNLNINFLRRPSADCDIIAKAKLIRMGKSLAVGEVAMYSEGVDEPVAHAVGTFSIPMKLWGIQEF